MKLVVFDCDGTLVDSQNGIVEAMNYAFTTFGLPPPHRLETLSVVGLSLPEAFAALAPDLKISERLAMAERYKNAFTELRHDPNASERLYPGARAVIETLIAREDIVLGIATGKSRKGVDRLLTREGWTGAFSTIHTADEHPSKPHPSMLLTAMVETGVGPDATIMIGDTTYDVEMSTRAGVRALGVTWGYHSAEDLEAAGTHALVDDYAEVIEELNRMFLVQGSTA